jgi:hypothetical protein
MSVEPWMTWKADVSIVGEETEVRDWWNLSSWALAACALFSADFFPTRLLIGICFFAVVFEYSVVSAPPRLSFFATGICGGIADQIPFLNFSD